MVWSNFAEDLKDLDSLSKRELVGRRRTCAVKAVSDSPPDKYKAKKRATHKLSCRTDDERSKSILRTPLLPVKRLKQRNEECERLA